MSQTLYVLQGIPGSGKSWLAMLMFRAMGMLAEVCSTDWYFSNPETGVYEFDPKKLGVNHQKNYERACAAMNEGKTVILDNTNIHCWECRDYVRHAQSLGMSVVFIRVTGNFKSIHGVPTEAIERMRGSMENLTLESVLASKKPWE